MSGKVEFVGGKKVSNGETRQISVELLSRQIAEGLILKLDRFLDPESGLSTEEKSLLLSQIFDDAKKIYDIRTLNEDESP